MLKCRKCLKEFSGWKRINGLLRNLKNRKFCLDCSPFRKHNTRATFETTLLDKKGCNQKKCEHCGKELSLLSKKWSGKYCNNYCHQQHVWSQSKILIEQTQTIPTKSPTKAKRYLREVVGIKCSKCNIVEWMGQEVPLVLDHIDGNPENWSLNNLRLICGNCDMQTSTYKGRNLGRGRFSRRMRYQTGKSH